MNEVSLVKEFRNRFHKDPEAVYFCPGRVNLIGEHIDYNGGKVMPAAITRGTWLTIGSNDNNELRLQGIDFPETAVIPVQKTYSRQGTAWFNYPLGMIDSAARAGMHTPGADLLFAGDLPIGSGLSSSASIEVLMGYAIRHRSGLAVDRPALAVEAKHVENHFMGMNCGIMDQFAVANGREDHAMLLDCDTLACSYIPVDLGDYRLVIINSRKDRKLIESKYNERFAQCQQVLSLLQQHTDMTNLCALTPAQLDSLQHLITDEVLLRRTRHVVTENDRVYQAAAALKAGEIKSFGQLLWASHNSLQKDYEVSGLELDCIVEFAAGFAACIGARMTGAGFGGCAIALVQQDAVDQFAEKLVPYYEKKIGYPCAIVPAGIGNGVHQVESKSLLSGEN